MDNPRDRVGRDLKIGDYVMYNQIKGRSPVMYIGIVESFTEKSAYLKSVDITGYKAKRRLVAQHTAIKIDKEFYDFLLQAIKDCNKTVEYYFENTGM